MANPAAASLDTEFHRGLGLYDSTMVVVGSICRCPRRNWPGLLIVLLGVPVYFAWRPKR